MTKTVLNRDICNLSSVILVRKQALFTIFLSRKAQFPLLQYDKDESKPHIFKLEKETNFSLIMPNLRLP